MTVGSFRGGHRLLFPHCLLLGEMQKVRRKPKPSRQLFVDYFTIIDTRELLETGLRSANLVMGAFEENNNDNKENYLEF